MSWVFVLLEDNLWMFQSHCSKVYSIENYDTEVPCIPRRVMLQADAFFLSCILTTQHQRPSVLGWTEFPCRHSDPLKGDIIHHHLGIARCLRWAREYVYWQRINEHIKMSFSLDTPLRLWAIIPEFWKLNDPKTKGVYCKVSPASSQEFHIFSQKWEFMQETSTLGCPQSNSSTEPAKCLMLKANWSTATHPAKLFTWSEHRESRILGLFFPQKAALWSQK